ncbi:hypothetical protein TWF788_008783 [Orbilia oligospora]|uniref:High-affinity Zn(2+) transporter zrt1 n=1 Tax=Orbilia oligospora TaxID=2813651 RepID=A0A6G1M058_ORBOL|nr:hypothetical protein TWF788_008783 [Orbilia oligospora]KAF3209638.1 hypothetical protein TWF191_011407 [Orbilia oligospora]KAF3239058.1 hypothetical protein TWF192_010135 [Orbilia oligospora]
MKKSVLFVSFAALSLAHSAGVKRQNTAQATSSAADHDHDHDDHDDITAVTACHLHGATQYCMHEATEYVILASATATEDLPSSYTDCHAHATQTWCVAPNGDEVQIAAEAQTTPAPTGADDHEDDHDHDHTAGTATSTTVPLSITKCHTHSTEIFCMAGETEYLVKATLTASEFPPEYTGCHSHGSAMYCADPSGDDVLVQLAGAEEEPSGEGEGEPQLHCHFHAGVEHCVGAEGEKSSAARICTRTDREYNIKLRVGLLFVILVTSALGVFGPILLSLVLSSKAYSVLLIFKQFGTGVIISTAFVHLFTHANLMFTNECLEGVEYEATTAAILMAGLFLSFLVEYLGQRIVHARHAKLVEANRENMSSNLMAEMKVQNEIVSVLVLEVGIIFHSLLIGLTLVVAGDSYFLTLFAVILFHQMFEGIALGTRIAALGTASPNRVPHGHLHSHSHSHDINRISHSEEPRPSEPKTTASSPEAVEIMKPVGVSLGRKLAFASAFALVTPIGMAIGIGVLDRFNGNDPSTIIAIGTLDALSAGILVWVGVVEMWAEDWMFGGEMTYAGFFTTILGGLGLVLGMGIMSFLGKWA